MDVYIAPDVADVLLLHPYLQDAEFRALPILEQLEQQISTLLVAHSGGDTRVRMHLGSWWPHAKGLSLNQIMDAHLSTSDAQLTIANEYGFENWARVEALGSSTLPEEFELALDDLLAGELESLSNRIVAKPSLTKERSAFGHQATLLHYLGANGVESHHQRTPMNAPMLAALLINHGAQIDATAKMYGGDQTPYDLASTSAHPYHAGISGDLNRVLCLM